MLKRVCNSHPPHPILLSSNSRSPAEAFLLFSQEITTTNLGFVDSRAPSLDVTIRGNEYTVYQSPTLLSSSRAGGTTGAGMYCLLSSYPQVILFLSHRHIS